VQGFCVNWSRRLELLCADTWSIKIPFLLTCSRPVSDMWAYNDKEYVLYEYKVFDKAHAR